MIPGTAQFQLELPGTQSQPGVQPEFPVTTPADTPALAAEVPGVGGESQNPKGWESL